MHVLRVFEMEMLCHLKEWDQVLQVVNVGLVRVTLGQHVLRSGQETIQSKSTAVDTYEAITDILVSHSFGSFE